MKTCYICRTHEINLTKWCRDAGIDPPEYSYMVNYIDNTCSVAVYVYHRSIDYYSQSEYVKSVREAKEYASLHCFKQLNSLWIF